MYACPRHALHLFPSVRTSVSEPTGSRGDPYSSVLSLPIQAPFRPEEAMVPLGKCSEALDLGNV